MSKSKVHVPLQGFEWGGGGGVVFDFFMLLFLTHNYIYTHNTIQYNITNPTTVRHNAKCIHIVSFIF